MGSLFVAVLPTLLAAVEPSTLVVLSRKVQVTPAEAKAVVVQATSLLLEAGAPLIDAAEAGQRLSKLGLKDATTCNGKPVCHAEFGKQLKVSWLILVSVSRVAGDRSLALELFDVADKVVADKESLLLPKGTSLTRAPLEAFGARLKARLAPEVVEVAPPPPLETDTPAKPALTPENTVTTLPPPLPPPETKSHVGSVILGGAGVVALGAAIALFVVGANTQAQVQGTAGADGRVRSTLTGSDAQAAAGAASLQLGLGGARLRWAWVSARLRWCSGERGPAERSRAPFTPSGVEGPAEQGCAVLPVPRRLHAQPRRALPLRERRELRAGRPRLLDRWLLPPSR